jgi:hypothetical protein
MGSPFRAHRRYDTDRYLVTPAKEVVRANPIEVYFVMNRSETAEALIILRYTKFRYEALSDRWHVSSHVGNTGRWQLVGLYKLISELRGSNKFKGQCYGRRLEEKLFYRLSMGEAYPGAILRSTENDHWWDDFTNVDHTFPIAAGYEQRYGKSFADAQAIVKSCLSYERDNEPPQPPDANAA